MKRLLIILAVLLISATCYAADSEFEGVWELTCTQDITLLVVIDNLGHGGITFDTLKLDFWVEESGAAEGWIYFNGEKAGPFSGQFKPTTARGSFSGEGVRYTYVAKYIFPNTKAAWDILEENGFTR